MGMPKYQYPSHIYTADTSTRKQEEEPTSSGHETTSSEEDEETVFFSNHDFLQSRVKKNVPVKTESRGKTQAGVPLGGQMA